MHKFGCMPRELLARGDALEFAEIQAMIDLEVRDAEYSRERAKQEREAEQERRRTEARPRGRVRRG